jgi:hypothetical protein
MEIKQDSAAAQRVAAISADQAAEGVDEAAAQDAVRAEGALQMAAVMPRQTARPFRI